MKHTEPAPSIVERLRDYEVGGECKELMLQAADIIEDAFEQESLLLDDLTRALKERNTVSRLARRMARSIGYNESSGRNWVERAADFAERARAAGVGGTA